MSNKCKFCGGDGGGFGLLPITDYDFDSDDEMASSVKHTVGYRCTSVSDCARRAVELGNPEGLAMVIETGREYLGGLVDEALRVRRAFSELAQSAAHTDDLVARENGYGVIGRGR